MLTLFLLLSQIHRCSAILRNAWKENFLLLTHLFLPFELLKTHLHIASISLLVSYLTRRFHNFRTSQFVKCLSEIHKVLRLTDFQTLAWWINSVSVASSFPQTNVWPDGWGWMNTETAAAATTAALQRWKRSALFQKEMTLQCVIPDRPFHNSIPSKSGDRLILCYSIVKLLNCERIGRVAIAVGDYYHDNGQLRRHRYVLAG